MQVNSPNVKTSYSVGELGKLAHVSVRTLHHYDELGLLTPSERSQAGYRRYSEADLAKLQQILFYKELGFNLKAIREGLSDPDFNRLEALQQQRSLIKTKVGRLQAMLGLIDKTLTSLEGGIQMTDKEMFEVFGDFNPNDHEAEVQERWGDTDAYKVSAQRTKRYTKTDWQRYKGENDAVNTRIAQLMTEGVAPDDERAMNAVDEARRLIDTWFYPCSRQMHANLGDMYVADPRFTATYEAIHPGMAQFIKEATAANAARD